MAKKASELKNHGLLTCGEVVHVGDGVAWSLHTDQVEWLGPSTVMEKMGDFNLNVVESVEVFLA